MLEDAGVALLLTQERLAETLPAHWGQTVFLDAEWGEVASRGVENPPGSAGAGSLAYVIYTSGSTGRPKGVMVTHGGLTNYLQWCTEFYRTSEGVGSVVHSSVSFDLTVTSLFPALLKGRPVFLAPEEGAVEALAEMLRRGRDYTLLKLTPTHLDALRHLLAGVKLAGLARVLVVGGEALRARQAGYWLERAPGTRLINEYGPTETVVGCCVYEASETDGPEGDVPVGRPIANTRLYVLDRWGGLAPPGAAGELYVGGAGVARGYLNRPALTAERFMPDPFSPEPGARVYRTGDLARRRPDGGLEFLGRIDHQVKIRGYRIELGEVEAALRRCASVRECVVAAREDVAGDQRLVGYVVTEGGAATVGAAQVGELREHLRRSLPEYMVPSAFVLLDELPLTPNGKVDRRALPSPEGARAEDEGAAGSTLTPVEELLAGVWSDVLRVAHVRARDNFFELGGHSLLATQLLSRISEVFGIEAPLRVLFEAPVLSLLAERIEETMRAEAGVQTPPVRRVERGAEAAVSFPQQRLWFIDRLEGGSAFYNVPLAVRLSGVLDVNALGRTLTEVVRRHEILRTHFAEVEGEPVQVISLAAPLKLPVINLSEIDEARRAAEVVRRANAETREPFELSAGHPLRLKLLRLGTQEHVVLLTMHHIITDGWSTGILIKEVAALYEAYRRGEASPLEELEVQYADFAAWQREWLQGEVLEGQLRYWREQLGGRLEVLELPADRPRPAVRSYRGATLPVRLPKTLTDALQELSRREGATLFMTLLAAFQTLLHRYTQQEDVPVGTPIAGRARANLEESIGCFANTLVLRTEVTGDLSFRELLGRVREVTLEALMHQDVPFEKVVEAIQPKRDLSHNPLFQVLLGLHNLPERAITLPELTLTLLESESITSRFDLALDMLAGPEGLRGSLEYSTDLFDERTMASFITHFENLLEGAVARPEQRLSQLPLLADSEREQLLVRWNEAAAEYAREKCLHEVFESHAARSPDTVAATYEGEHLTYGELNRRANQLARHLRARGVSAGDPVAICVERSLEMLVGLLGVFKAGAAYVPIDPSYPQERVRFMLEDSGAALLLTQQNVPPHFLSHGTQAIRLDADWHLIAAESDANIDSPTAADNLAYVIYTSGSTGVPKGVQVSHRSVVCLLEVTRPTFDFGGRDVWTVFHSYAFDFSVWEIWGCLLSGGRLVIVPRYLTQSPAEFYRMLCEERVSVLSLTPSALRQLVQVRAESADGGRVPAFRLVVCGGEAFPRGLAPRLLEWKVPVWEFLRPDRGDRLGRDEAGRAGRRAAHLDTVGTPDS